MAEATPIGERLLALRRRLPDTVRLVAVSKFHPVEAMMQAYAAGQRVFGESRVRELVEKRQQLPDDVKLHYIAHLQRNKVRAVLPCVDMIESVDSVELLRLIDREAERLGRKIDVLLQVHVAREATKTGFAVEELLSAAVAGELSGLDNVKVRGVMAMASLTDDMEQVAREFDVARHTFDVLKEEFYADDPGFDVLSMGMTDDWPVAVAHGSTQVRIGSAIFGPRQY